MDFNLTAHCLLAWVLGSVSDRGSNLFLFLGHDLRCVVTMYRDLSSSMSSSVSAGSYISTGEASPRPLLLSGNGGNAPWTAGTRPQQRPRLQLKPRSSAPLGAADEARRAALFGCARPREEVLASGGASLHSPPPPLRGSGGSPDDRLPARAPADGGGWHTVGPRRQGAAATDDRNTLGSGSLLPGGRFGPPRAFRGPPAWDHGEGKAGSWGEEQDDVRDSDGAYFPGRRALPTRRADLF